MKKYMMPDLQVIEDVILETVYAASGTVPEDTPPANTPSDEFSFTTRWTNHNGGSHSDLLIEGKYTGSQGGNGVIMDFVVENFVLDQITQSSGFAVTNQTTTSFTITRIDRINPGQTIGFNISLTAKDSKYHGAVAETGDYTCPASVRCISHRLV